MSKSSCNLIQQLTLNAAAQPRTETARLMLAAVDEIHVLRAALMQIACPKRPDGTYNNCREACEHIAKEALKNG